METIIDAHHHIWRMAHTPWLNGPQLPRIFGDYNAIRRDYPVEEFMADATPHGVVKSVYVQVNVAPGAEVTEAEWAQSVGDRSGFPHGITAFADLAATDVGAVLDREMQCANLRAIRQQLHWHENPLYCFASRPDVMKHAHWRRGFASECASALMTDGFARGLARIWAGTDLENKASERVMRRLGMRFDRRETVSGLPQIFYVIEREAFRA